jgi:D-arabinose 1-dehydrogenase-like Zn-dependent alcohol dehydrogenase
LQEIPMKAMVLHGPNLPFAFEQRPDPVAGPGEAVARVITCGAGLTIQHAKTGRRKIAFPRIIGHEITGLIVETGPGVRGLKVGDAVTTYFYLNCGHCRWCLQSLEPLCENTGGQVGLECDGAYAEYVKLPAQNFIKLPVGLDYNKHPAEIGVVTDAPRRRRGGRDRGCDRCWRRARDSSVDDGEVGAGARHCRRHQAGKV